jgi:hypothetical protein
MVDPKGSLHFLKITFSQLELILSLKPLVLSKFSISSQQVSNIISLASSPCRVAFHGGKVCYEWLVIIELRSLRFKYIIIY